MKKLLILLLLAGTLWSCNNHKTAENKNLPNPSEVAEHQFGETNEKLILNNGVKWKVDMSTSNNVRDLQIIIEKFNSGSDRSFIAYKKAQGDLQHGLDKMIIECKMKGPAHHALHQWLEPLIEQVTKFKQVASVSEAVASLKGIQEQLNRYNQYFEF